MTDIIERLRIESRREPHEPIWRDAIAEIEALRAKTTVTMGVGSGDGKLFVHGDYESIKAAQEIVFRAERLAGALRDAKEKMLAQVKWVACDCGCEREKPADAVSVAWLRASALLREQEEGR